MLSVKPETTIRGIIETAIAQATNAPFTLQNWIKSNAASFTLKVANDFVVEYQKPSRLSNGGFTVYSWAKECEGVWHATRTPSGSIGKIVELKHRSEGLSNNYTPDSLLNKIRI